MNNKYLINIGFKEIEHFTIGNTVIYDLGRRRQLTISDFGGFNEMMFISEADEIDTRIMNELICLHNYDYDGKLNIDKIEMIIKALS